MTLSSHHFTSSHFLILYSLMIVILYKYEFAFHDDGIFSFSHYPRAIGLGVGSDHHASTDKLRKVPHPRGVGELMEPIPDKEPPTLHSIGAFSASPKFSILFEKKRG
ncbi:hypothetical protein BHE74_00032878 [Ensete ventricosum]|nr:hypothetical protein BHE74_00032878 [Ensete ventricosum]